MNMVSEHPSLGRNGHHDVIQYAPSAVLAHRLVSCVAGHSDNSEDDDKASGSGGVDATHALDQAESIRKYLKMRRLRHLILPGDFFADPAWDILLDLYAAELEGRKIAVSSACVAAAVPPSTALRWIAKLEAAGAVSRSCDPFDGRRTLLHLSVNARSTLAQWVQQAL